MRVVVLRSIGRAGTAAGARIGVSPGTSTQTAVDVTDVEAGDLADLRRDPTVASVCAIMPTALIRPSASTAHDAEGQWGLAATGADACRFDGAGTNVAILDTGIDRDHPAFAGVDLVERDFTGYGDGDRNGHGTHCAGTILGRDVGVRIGVARGVTRALVGKVLSDDGSGGSQMLFAALQWAVASRADIISMSLGFDFPGLVERLVGDGWPVALATSQALEAYRGNLRMFDCIMRLMKANAPFGTVPLVIAAAGNESRRHVEARYRIAASLPAAAEDVVSVAAAGRHGGGLKVADFSNIHPLLTAPGVAIRSARAGGGLVALDGTSMACPHVAGIAALWWEAIRRGGATPTATNVRAKLIANAKRNPFADPVDEADVGQGLVQAP